jgi:hypothetical protein
MWYWMLIFVQMISEFVLLLISILYINFSQTKLLQPIDP